MYKGKHSIDRRFTGYHFSLCCCCVLFTLRKELTACCHERDDHHFALSLVSHALRLPHSLVKRRIRNHRRTGWPMRCKCNRNVLLLLFLLVILLSLLHPSFSPLRARQIIMHYKMQNVFVCLKRKRDRKRKRKRNKKNALTKAMSARQGRGDTEMCLTLSVQAEA